MKRKIRLPGGPPRVSEVIVGSGLAEQIPRDLESRLGIRRPFWIWDETVWKLWGEDLCRQGWPALGSGRVILFAASEPNKRLSNVEHLARLLVAAGADRQSALVAVGGGVTGDVVGFVAAIYMRGIPHYQIPTTLLAQVDSSIGGKTGVDLPEGKNLLGAFHQPEAIWMDSQFLKTLPQEEFRQGMAEVIKTALLGDADLWNFLQDHRDRIKQRATDTLHRVVSACCEVKAKVVECDEKEAGYRRILNLGHTVGHALERLSGYRIRHGDAVAMGLLCAARLAVQMGETSLDLFIRLRELCEFWELPTSIPLTHSAEAILDALRTDKKWTGGKLHFILPVRAGRAVDRDDIDLKELSGVIEDLQEDH